jgi:hypothetical protein
VLTDLPLDCSPDAAATKGDDIRFIAKPYWLLVLTALLVTGACSDEPPGGAPTTGEIEFRQSADNEFVWVRLALVESFGGFEHNSHLISLSPEVQDSVAFGTVEQGIYRAECHGGVGKPSLDDPPDAVLRVQVQGEARLRIVASSKESDSCTLEQRT